MALIKCPECNGNLSDKANVCPHCGYPVKNVPEPVEYEYQFTSQTDNSQGAAFMQIIAWILWGGGLILAIALGTSSRSFGTFFITAISFGVSGGFAWAVGLLFEDVHGIFSLLQSLQLIKMEKKAFSSNAASGNASPRSVSHLPVSSSLHMNQWKCKHCGRYNSNGKIFCSDCGKTK